MAKDMGGILNIALIGGAAYLAYQWWQNQASSTPPASVNPGGNPVPVGVVTPVTPIVAPVPPTTQPILVTTPVSPEKTTTIQPPTGAGKIGGYSYSTRGEFTQAVIKALSDAASGSQSQSIDTWNWYMANVLGFRGMDTGGVDPTIVANQIGIGRSDSTRPDIYVMALMTLGLLPYPSGLTGLGALAQSIQSINRHPLAQGAPGNQGMFYLKPRKVVM